MATETGVLKKPVNGKDDEPSATRTLKEHELLSGLSSKLDVGEDMSRRAPLHDEEVLGTLLRLSTGLEKMGKFQDDLQRSYEQQSKLLEKVLEGSGKASLPTWLMSILVVAALSLLGWIYLQQIGSIEKQVSVHDTFIHNTREQMIAHGWKLDRDGNLYYPDDGTTQKGK